MSFYKNTVHNGIRNNDKLILLSGTVLLFCDVVINVTGVTQSLCKLQIVT